MKQTCLYKSAIGVITKREKVVFYLLLLLLLSSSFVQASGWSSIKLIATSGSQISSTNIAFNSAMTNGLDRTYDAGLLKGGSDLLIYSYLVQDYAGVPFAIQALPDYGYSSLVIPLGLDFKTGGSVVFSVEVLNLSPDCKIILEDKLTNTLTDLSKISYPTAIAANSVITNRFVLHFSPVFSWIGTTTDWNTAANWSTNAVPTLSDHVIISNIGNLPVVNQVAGIPSACNNLTILSGAVLTIPAGMGLTVSGILTNNSIEGIVIGSNASGTGSLIINGSTAGTGTVRADRFLTFGAWHLVSSPLSGQTCASFLTTNTTSIATNGLSRGMIDYNPASNSWNSFFTNATGGNLGAGKGFSMRVGVTSSAVSFTGSLQVGNQSVSADAGFFNCIGNPYTSAIGINGSSSSIANFLASNASKLDIINGAIYVWDQPDASNGKTGKYTAISNATAAFEVQSGQAFMVKMKTGVSSLDFTSAMQIHNPALALKSTKEAWPTIKLEATVTDQKSSTTIAFISGMTKGLDPTYDAGLFKGGSDLIIYTRLVDDSGIPFAIQALPNDYSNLIIPVGIDYKTGGNVVFSAERINLPADCRIVLEDKMSNTFTDLSKNAYSTTLEANSSVTDRFLLHTSSQTTGLNENSTDRLNAWAISNHEIRISGFVSPAAIATLYDVQGRAVLTEKLEEGSLNTISASGIKSGIYVLFVKENEKSQGFKILFKE